MICKDSWVITIESFSHRHCLYVFIFVCLFLDHNGEMMRMQQEFEKVNILLKEGLKTKQSRITKLEKELTDKIQAEVVVVSNHRSYMYV